VHGGDLDAPDVDVDLVRLGFALALRGERATLGARHSRWMRAVAVRGERGRSNPAGDHTGLGALEGPEERRVRGR
jgi:hypothetical protein